MKRKEKLGLTHTIIPECRKLGQGLATSLRPARVTQQTPDKPRLYAETKSKNQQPTKINRRK